MAEFTLIFDGVCVLCETAVKFIIRHDRKARFKFATAQGEHAQALRASYDIEESFDETFVLIADGRCLYRSDAALEVARHLDGYWYLLNVFRVLPMSLRDGLYSWIARHRYRWFGRRDACLVPGRELAARFAD